MYIIGSTRMGGVPLLTYSIAIRLKDNFNLVLIAPNDGPYFDKFKQAGVKVIDLPIRGLNPLLPFIIARHIKENTISLVHTHGKAAGLHGRIASLLADKPAIHSFHGIHFKQYGVFSRMYLAIERMLGKATTFFVATAEHERQTIIELGFAQQQKIKLIRNAVSNLNHDSNIVREKFMLMSVGRFYAGKGQNDLISAMPQILKNTPQAKLILIGEGPELESAKELTKKLDLDNNIQFTGGIAQDLLDQYYNRATIFISPSLGEGFGLTLAEAGQVALPAIATDVTGNNEIVEHNVSGLLVPPQNPKKIAEAVIDLLNNPNKAHLFASTLQTKIKTKFTMEQLISETAQLYRDVANRDD